MKATTAIAAALADPEAPPSLLHGGVRDRVDDAATPHVRRYPVARPNDQGIDVAAVVCGDGSTGGLRRHRRSSASNGRASVNVWPDAVRGLRLACSTPFDGSLQRSVLRWRARPPGVPHLVDPGGSLDVLLATTLALAPIAYRAWYIARARRELELMNRDPRAPSSPHPGCHVMISFHPATESQTTLSWVKAAWVRSSSPRPRP